MNQVNDDAFISYLNIYFNIQDGFDEEVEIYSSNVNYDDENPEYLSLNTVTDIDEAIRELIRIGVKQM